MGPLSPVQVANYFIQKSLDEGRLLTPMQVIKLTYLAHGWNYAYFSEDLLSEAVQAWQYGPVIRSLYHELKEYGNRVIPELIRDRDGSFSKVPESDERRALLDKVWDVYSKYSGGQLSTMTHQKGTPWHQVYEREGGKLKRWAPIPNNLIRAHYAQRAAG